MRVRLSAWPDGAGWSTGLAAALLAFSLLAVVAVLQSPDSVLWTGQRAIGVERGGLVIFHWQGQVYSVAKPGYGSADNVAVYFDPAHPEKAVADNVADRVGAGLLVGGPLAAAVLVFAIGLIRRRIRRRRRWKRGAASFFGSGLDPEFVSRVLRQRRAEQPGLRIRNRK